MTSGFILTFHSHNISGATHATNDHVALDETLGLARRLRIPVLRLLDVVKRLRRGDFAALPERFACITFDDGTDYDWADMRHAEQGVQPSMHSILREHSRHLIGPWWLRKACATTFVIASPAARAEMEAALPVRLSDSWWREAQSCGLLDIGSHGWNHVHPLVSDMKGRPELIESFHRIESPEDVALQMDSSFEFIRRKAGGDSARIFAYPYGQVSEFIATEYFPRQANYLAACGTDPRPLRADGDPWRLPRYVCGWHWKSVEELGKLFAER